MGFFSRTSGRMGRFSELARTVIVKVAASEVSGAALEVTTMDIYISCHSIIQVFHLHPILTHTSPQTMDVPVISIDQIQNKKNKIK